jgi:hypothetical protein
MIRPGSMPSAEITAYKPLPITERRARGTKPFDEHSFSHKRSRWEKIGSRAGFERTTLRLTGSISNP